MAAWGLLSASTAFVREPTSFYTLRFLLGVAEAGFFPGMVFYLTLWFPKAHRARFTAIFMFAAFPWPPSSAARSRPSSWAWMASAGLHGWQWLFLIEGLPACLLAFAVLKLLPDGPASAPWLVER